jgi:hypothetical protein
MALQEVQKRQKAIAAVVREQEETIARLEKENNLALTEKSAYEAQYEEHRRQLKEASDQTNTAT